jgi:xanthine dehydrogenase YagS FAD-binding subunit
MCVALAALDAQVRVTGVDGDRVIPFSEYHRLPDDKPWLDNWLRPGELVTALDLPPEDFSRHYTYLKLRDRVSYAFALVSVAVVMRLEEGRMSEVRVALGGVAHKPWRSSVAESGLTGERVSREAFMWAAGAILDGAVGHGGNDFKIELARRAIVRALEQAAAAQPQSVIDKRIGFRAS